MSREQGLCGYCVSTTNPGLAQSRCSTDTYGANGTENEDEQPVPVQQSRVWERAGGLRPPQLTQQGLLYTRKRKPKTPRPRGEVLSLKPHGMRLNKQSKLMTLLEVHAASEMWATQIPQDDN